MLKNALKGFQVRWWRGLNVGVGVSGDAEDLKMQLEEKSLCGDILIQIVWAWIRQLTGEILCDINRASSCLTIATYLKCTILGDYVRRGIELRSFWYLNDA